MVNVNGTATFMDDECCGSENYYENMAGAAAEKMFGDEQQKRQENADRDFLNKFISYMKSGKLKDDILKQSKKYDVPPKMIAKNFFLKILGIISDVGGLVLNTACNAIDAIISGVSALLHGAVSIIHSVASAIGRVLTLNQTATCY